MLVKIYIDDGLTGFGEACAWEPEFYGSVKVPQGPGMGVELDEQTLAKYIINL